MNNSKKSRKTLSKKILCLLAIGMIYSSIGYSYAYDSSGESKGVVENQQTRVTVQGKVVDTKGEPLIGVSVAVKGTTNGTLTDVEGAYSISTTTDATLTFSYVGYKAQSVVVGNQKTINITMLEDAQMMSEVVVVGFGVQKKENLTGAVGTVDVEKVLGSKPLSDVTKALQGTVPGLTITYNSGNLGSGANINIRGVGTVIDGKEKGSPLILVDGVPSDLTLINPDDIDNISVLKDASSASIYGTRGAFGVVLITTKKGKAEGDKVKFSYSGNLGYSRPGNLVQFLDPTDELPIMMQAAQRNSPGSRSESFGMYHDTLLPGIINWKEKYGSSRSNKDMSMIYGEDWEIIGGRAYTYRVWDAHKVMLRDWTPTQSHNLSAQGRLGANSTFLVSLGYSEQSGFMRINTDKLKRYNANMSLTTQLAPWLKSNVGVLFSRKDHKEPFNYYNSSGLNIGEQNGYFGYYMRWGQYFPYGNYDGVWFRHASGLLANASMNSLQTDLMRLNANLTADITKDLQFIAEYSFTTETTDRTINGHPIQVLDFWNAGWDPNDIMGTAKGYAGISPGSAYDKIGLGNSKNQNHVFNAYGVYTKTFNASHNLKVTAGTNIEKNEFKRFYSERRNVMDPSVPDINLATGNQYTTSAWAILKPKHNEYAIAGFFGRINYDYQGKYLLELNGRYDGSSSFPIGELWGFFPSGSIGYRITEEAFMEGVKPVLSDLKLRASIGSIGNQAVAENAFRPMMDITTADWIVNGVLASTPNTPGLVDPSLTWEKVTTLDIGVDARFLNNMFGVTFDWFQRTNKGILRQAVTLPSATGITAPLTNAGDIRTRGYELMVDFNYPINKNISLHASAGLSDYQTTVTKWDNPTKLLGSFYEGMKIGEIWGFETDRLFQKDDFNADGTLKTGIPDQTFLQQGAFVFGPGDVKYKDLDGDKEITAGDRTAINPGDMKVIGNSTPRYQYNFRIGGEFYGFDIDVFFQGVGKRDYWANSDLILPMYQRADAVYEHQLDYWTEDNTNAYWPNPYFPHMTNKVGAFAPGSNNFAAQSRYLLSLSYLRLKNLTVGYTLPANLTNKIGIDKLRVYFSGQNLAEFKSDRLPVDPEINETEAQWGRTYPYPRTISFGLQVNF